MDGISGNVAASSYHALIKELVKLPDYRERLGSIGLTADEGEYLLKDWQLYARPQQVPPPGNWLIWLILSGRGWGKTRTAAELLRVKIRTIEYSLVVGATADAIRDVMLDGRSGLLSICRDDERPRYIANRGRLEWPNGAKTILRSAVQPDRIRGLAPGFAWLDEFCTFQYPQQVLEQIALACRDGDLPQMVITSTPLPIQPLRDLIKRHNPIITRGSTYDNCANLSPIYLDNIKRLYEGTRLGRQEIYGEILEDNPDALWTTSVIDGTRIEAVVDEYQRIIVAVDPAVTNNEGSDACGIVVLAQIKDHAYVLEDATIKAHPAEWGKRVIALYQQYKADRVIAEVNQGGALVEQLLLSIDPGVSYKGIHATRGKHKRAEPVAALYEQGRVHHVGYFGELETEMTQYNPYDVHAKSPNRMDALVWGVTELLLVNRNQAYLDAMLPSGSPFDE